MGGKETGVEERLFEGFGHMKGIQLTRSICDSLKGVAFVKLRTWLVVLAGCKSFTGNRFAVFTAQKPIYTEKHHI